MAEQEFSEFVKRKTERVMAEEAIDWAKRRADWLRELGELYTSMENHLRPYTQAGEIQIERTPIQLREEYLGTYKADKLTFRIGRDKIIAQPIGATVIGARGRVDLSAPRHRPGGRPWSRPTGARLQSKTDRTSASMRCQSAGLLGTPHSMTSSAPASR